MGVPNLAWGGFSNGRIPRENLVDIGSGKFLQADAAYNWAKFAAAFRDKWGASLYLDWYQDAYRDYARQQDMWNHRGDGFPWPNSVAAPGHSVHGWARSVDCTGYGSEGSARHNWMVENGKYYGWSWNYGKELGESWHWDYLGPITTTAGDGGIGAFDMLDDNDKGWMRLMVQQELASLAAAYLKVPGQGFGWPQHTFNAVAELPTNDEMGQALTSTVSLVNEHADGNKEEILGAIDDIPSGSGGGSSSGGNYTLSLNIPEIPGTATGTATPA